jgi:hypothetical protein
MSYNGIYTLATLLWLRMSTQCSPRANLPNAKSLTFWCAAIQTDWMRCCSMQAAYQQGSCTLLHLLLSLSATALVKRETRTVSQR